jgi:uncharacterized protein YuzE
MSSLKVGPYTFDRAHYDPDADVLYLSLGGLDRAADFDETPDGHAVSFDEDGNLIGLTLVGIRRLIANAEGREGIVLGLPRKVEPGDGEPAEKRTTASLAPADLAPVDLKISDLDPVLA